MHFKLFSSFRGQFPQKDLEVLFPGMSADFTSENLSAAWYLIENHSNTRLGGPVVLRVQLIGSVGTQLPLALPLSTPLSWASLGPALSVCFLIYKMGSFIRGPLFPTVMLFLYVSSFVPPFKTLQSLSCVLRLSMTPLHQLR